MVQSGILLETQLHYIGTSTLIIDVYQKESEIEEKSLQEMFCYLVPKYSLHQTLRCLKKKKPFGYIYTILRTQHYHLSLPFLLLPLSPAPLTPC